MMRGALRRLLWTIPTLLALSVLLFWMLSSFMSRTRAGAEEATDKLPLFVNFSPRSVVDAARDALNQVAAGGAEQAEGERTLVRLGGAALPHVLPDLDALPPERRARVALALVPVARRMGVLEPGQAQSAESAVVFFSRFWQDRAVDFRPSVVRRLVRRLRLRGLALRYKDLVELDTYALPQLMAELNRARAEDDRVGLARISRVLSHIMGRPWVIRENAGAREATEIAEKWDSFWQLERANYSTPDAAGRVTEMLIQTQYGRWASETVRRGIQAGTVTSNGPGLSRRAALTLWLVTASLLGGLGLGAGVGAAAASQGWRTRTQVRRLVSWSTGIVLVSMSGVWVHAFSATVAWATLTAFFVNAGRVALYQRAASLCESPGAQLAKRPRAWIDKCATSVSMLGADLSWLVSLVFGIEVLLKLPGLGLLTLTAVRTGDLAWLMALCLFCAFGVAVLQILSDTVLQNINRSFGRRRQAHGAGS